MYDSHPCCDGGHSGLSEDYYVSVPTSVIVTSAAKIGHDCSHGACNPVHRGYLHLITHLVLMMWTPDILMVAV